MILTGDDAYRMDGEVTADGIDKDSYRQGELFVLDYFTLNLL